MKQFTRLRNMTKGDVHRKWVKQSEKEREGAGETAVLTKTVSYEAFKGWTQ